MAEPIIEINAENVDTTRIVAELQAAVDQKLQSGAYADTAIARAERFNLINLKTDDFASFYLQCLRDSVNIDISDFPIRERRAWLAPVLVRLKKSIWSLLKFYTYRLWSQQNQVNALLVAGLEGVEEKYRDRVARLEARVAELEKRTGAGAPPPPPAA